MSTDIIVLDHQMQCPKRRFCCTASNSNSAEVISDGRALGQAHVKAPMELAVWASGRVGEWAAGDRHVRLVDDGFGRNVELGLKMTYLGIHPDSFYSILSYVVLFKDDHERPG